ncbi:prepilin-type N-terminal cleavage/methylation domain-containing protein [Sulfurimonas sp.]
MRKAFTLIELMISIMILSIIMLFLYKSYSELNLANKVYKEESLSLQKTATLKKSIYLDISLALYKSISISNVDKQTDTLFMQSTHSLHRRINPYIVYVVNNSKLYRVESFKKLQEYPFDNDAVFDVDYIGKVKIFRVYKSQNKEAYLLDILFDDTTHIIQKVKLLNEF